MISNYSSNDLGSRSLWLQRHESQHLLPLIHMALWVAGLRALLRNQRALESGVLSVFLSVCLAACLFEHVHPQCQKVEGCLDPRSEPHAQHRTWTPQWWVQLMGNWLKWSLDNHSVIVPCVSRCHGGQVSLGAILCVPCFTAEKYD